MMIELRAASRSDAPQLGCLVETLWPGVRLYTRALFEDHQMPDRQTTLALSGGKLLGFVDSFTTASLQGTERWEIDLLGVAPQARLEGLGRSLVNCSLAAGRRSGGSLARALVRQGNLAGEALFRSVGFDRDEESLTLLIACRKYLHVETGELLSGLVRVQTLTYSGAWWEGELTSFGLREAARQVGREGIERVGVLVSDCQAALLRSAPRWGFEPQGRYRWWKKELGPSNEPE